MRTSRNSRWKLIQREKSTCLIYSLGKWRPRASRSRFSTGWKPRGSFNRSGSICEWRRKTLSKSLHRSHSCCIAVLSNHFFLQNNNNNNNNGKVWSDYSPEVIFTTIIFCSAKCLPDTKPEVCSLTSYSTWWMNSWWILNVILRFSKDYEWDWTRITFAKPVIS